jgi:hypothetical protein
VSANETKLTESPTVNLHLSQVSSKPPSMSANSPEIVQFFGTYFVIRGTEQSRAKPKSA